MAAALQQKCYISSEKAQLYSVGSKLFVKKTFELYEGNKEKFSGRGELHKMESCESLGNEIRVALEKHLNSFAF